METIERDVLLRMPILERAEALWEMLGRNNWIQQELAQRLEITPECLSRYLTPFKLDDEVKEKMRALALLSRPKMEPLEVLCRLESGLQRELWNELPRDLSATKQAAWLRERCASRGIVLSKDRYRRRYRAKRIDRLTLSIATLGWKVQWYLDEMSRLSADGRDRALAVDQYPRRKQMLRDSLEVLTHQLGTLKSMLDLDEDGERIYVSRNSDIRTLTFGEDLGCMWPVGEPGEQNFTFCGQNILPGKPYCADHDREAHVRNKGDQKEPAFDRPRRH